MPQTRFRLCALVALAFSIGCSGKDEGPTLEGGGDSSGAGGPTATGGSNPDNEGGGALSAGNGSLGGTANGGVANAGGRNGSASGGSGGTSGNGAALGGTGSGGKGSGGKGSGGSGSGGKGSGGSSAGGTGSGGKSSGGASSGGSSACPELTSELCGMTAQHNLARANVNPVPTTPLPSMSWDTTVAAAAQTWADQCKFSHNAAGYGQNLYASAGSGAPSPMAVVTSWVSEVADYDYAANACSGPACGHYTQVVWRGSTLVGCGFKLCSTQHAIRSPISELVHRGL